jgi:hypothetical protein
LVKEKKIAPHIPVFDKSARTDGIRAERNQRKLTVIKAGPRRARSCCHGERVPRDRREFRRDALLLASAANIAAFEKICLRRTT